MNRPEGDNVEVTFDFLQSDLLRSNFWWLTRQRSVILLYLLFSAALLTNLGLGILRGWDRASPWHSLVFAFMLAVVPLALYFGVRRTYAQVKPEQVRKCYRFDAEGFVVSDGLANANVSWRAVQRAVETTSAFHLFVQKQWFHVVPRRAFSADQLVRMRSIVRAALGPAATLLSDIPTVGSDGAAEQGHEADQR